MKFKISILMAFAMAMLSFKASADDYLILQFSNPNAVEKITSSYRNEGEEIGLVGDQATYTPFGPSDNPVIYLKDGYTITAIRDITNGYEFDDSYDFYYQESYGYWSIDISYLAGWDIEYGDTLLITISGGEPEPVPVTTSVQIVDGTTSEVYLYNITQEKAIELTTTNPTDVTFNEGDELFIGAVSSDGLYRLEVDEVEVPGNLQAAYGDYFGFTLTAESDYYPQDGGSIVIYPNAPAPTTYDITFSFTNEGTEGFVKQMKIGSEDVDDVKLAGYLTDGKITVEEGTTFEMAFDTENFVVVAVTVNGAAVEDDEYENDGVDADLAFVFNVTEITVNKVTVVSAGWENLVVSDENDDVYTLTGESTELEVPKEVTALIFTAAEGYEIPEGGVVVGEDTYDAGEEVAVTDGMTINVTCELYVEPTRSVYLEVNDVESVTKVVFGEDESLEFDEDGKLTLTVSEENYEVQIVTSKPIKAIETDEEGTLTVPELPSNDVMLDLSDCVDDQTITITIDLNTGVDGVEAPAERKVIYTINGIRIDDSTELPAGIYVINGKKEVVR